MVLLAVYLGGFALTAVAIFCVLLRALLDKDAYYTGRGYAGTFSTLLLAAALSLVAGICWLPLLWLVLRSLIRGH